MDWIPLNVFQRLTRHWDGLHPYNAAQVMKLSGRIDHSRLIDTWNQMLQELRLAHVQDDGRRYRWRKSRPSEKVVALTEVSAGTSLDQFMSVELNRPFDAASGEVFRPFIIDEGDSYFMGVVYHHWIADSYSIRLLLREWFLRLHDPAAARRKPFDAPEQGYWGLFGPNPGGWSIAESILNMVKWGTRFGRARRVNFKRFKELESDFTFHRGRDGLIDDVAAAAKRRGVTVNDIFLAAMGMVCQELLPLDQTIWRRELVLGTIVDLRGEANRALGETFGLYLGFTTVFCRPEELAEQDRLIREIHRQIAMQKAAHSAQASMMRMAGALVVGRMLGWDRLLELYRKRFTMTAGISNVNLNRDWPSTYFPSPLEEYIRVSPCGPLMPVVFTPTTLGRSLDVGVTCRRSIIPAEGIHVLAERFMQHLEEFAQTGKADLPTMSLSG